MIFQKFVDKGFFGSLKAILQRLRSRAIAPISRLDNYRKLKRQNYTIDFVNEGSIKVRLPEVSTLEIILGIGVSVNRNIAYQNRPFAEVLLRKTIYEIYESGYISRDLSIIDIGNWISDNSIVWSHYLADAAKVIAIDPSRDNITYGQNLANINNVENIKFVQAVCADKSGIKLDFDGTIDLASFKASTTQNYVVSTTIDEILYEEGLPVGFFHIDVEGFELSVLKGAMTVITRDLPVISFEQHISKENVNDITSFLKGFNYRVFMVNEVLPGCGLDCRNFLAFPSEKGLPKLTSYDQQNGRDMGIYSAVIGDVLIEI
ncbi:FkbM family methyltransferase [Candidatus Pelagibacter sp.]|nr:FkbM family methyltransferase [Candidatus Pelagibacter sp.]